MKQILAPYFERVRGTIRPGSDRMQQLLSKWIPSGILHKKSILVTGSNGKGSTCAYLESILRAHGYKTGLYTSPHLISPCERIRVQGVPIDESVFAKLIQEVDEQSKLHLPDATFFEIMTACAFIFFHRAQVDFTICEIGLGGRCDSTNVLAPVVSVLTSVSLEHTEYLGDSLKKIALDKSYIARRNRPFIVGDLEKEALEGVEETCDKIGARLVRVNRAGSNGNSSSKSNNITAHNYNLSLATAALNALTEELPNEFKLDSRQLKLGVEKMFWPGRFDVRKYGDVEVIFDAAHNSNGFEYFSKQYLNSKYSNYSKQKCVLVYASLNDKDWKKTFLNFPAICHHLILTEFPSERVCPAEDFKVYLDSLSKQNKFNIKYEIIPDFKKAFAHGASLAPDYPIVVTGSIAFLGTMMEYLNLEVFPNVSV